MSQPNSVKRNRVVNSYDGYRPAKENEVTREVDPSTLSAEDFWASFVVRREPCVLRDLYNKDINFKALKKWTESASYLKGAAGDENVSVERRDKGGRYGLGREEVLSFGALVDAIQDGDDTLYLTAQDLPESDFMGRPGVITPPLRSEKIKSDLTLRPRLLGGLIPQSISLWLGVSREPATTGLHVDYHDNLYILLKGRKTLTLFSPADADNMYTCGELLKIHQNGRINFRGCETEADGRHPLSERAMRAAEELNSAVAAADEDGGGDEDLVEKAMEEVLDAECFSENGGDESEEGDENHDGVAREKSCPNPNTKQPLGQIPDNFSKIDDLLNYDTTKFPLLSGIPYSISELRAGDALYFPCGWFHNVTSRGDVAVIEKSMKGKNDAATTHSTLSSWHPDAHLSLNIWFHPPDGKVVNRPYTSDFWEKDWVDRCKNPHGLQ